MTAEPLTCRWCETRHAAEERFCPACGMPLTFAPEPGHARSPRARDKARHGDGPHERARKVKPQYGEGRLVRVVTARHQAEAELLQGLLLEEGVPSLLRRTSGFDVPDFLASGPRDVLVPEAGLATARDALGLHGGSLAPGPTPRRPAPAWVRAVAAALALLLLAASAAGVLSAL